MFAMTEGLPKGLITTTGGISSEIHGLVPVEIEKIAQLWKVFNANKSVLRNGTGYRLENFFWRIWSSSHVCNSLSASTLSALFTKISDDNPLGTFQLQSRDAKLKHQGDSPDQATAPQISSLSREGSETPPGTYPAKGQGPLLSILRNSNTAGQAAPATPARILITEPFARPNTAFTSSADSNGEPTPKQGRKEPETFLIGTSEFSSKRKVAVIKHRSSSASTSVDLPGYSRLSLHEFASSSFSEDHNQIPDSDPDRPAPLEEPGIPSPQPTPAQQAFTTGSDQTLTASRPATSIRSTPPPTGFTASSIHRHRSAGDSPTERPGPSSSLVDRDFRTRFAEKRRLEVSGVSPLTTLSLRQQGSGEIRESKSPSPPGRSLPACEFTGNDDDHLIEPCSTPAAQAGDRQDVSQQLDSVSGSPNFTAPRYRVQSQLSLMIQRLRQKEGDCIESTVEQNHGEEVMETPET